MEKYLPIMTEDYKKKHYGEGIFQRIHKNTAKVSVMVYVFFAVVFAGCLYALKFVLPIANQCRELGEMDMIIFFYGLTAVLVFFALVSVAVIVLSIVRQKRGAEKLKELCAKENGYTVEEVNEFERQALEMESRAIRLVDTVKKAVSDQKDGILTRDYVYLTLGSNVLIKYSDLKVACLVKQTIRAGQGSSRVGIEYLVVGLIGKNGASVVAECSMESGTALIEYLKEKCPGLDTQEGRVLSSREYDDLWAVKSRRAR